MDFLAFSASWFGFGRVRIRRRETPSGSSAPTRAEPSARLIRASIHAFTLVATHSWCTNDIQNAWTSSLGVQTQEIKAHKAFTLTPRVPREKSHSRHVLIIRSYHEQNTLTHRHKDVKSRWARLVLAGEPAGNPACRMVFVLCTFGFITPVVGSVSVKFWPSLDFCDAHLA